VRQEIRFAAPLPPDVPAPPARLGDGVRWPDGVYRPPGERPDGGVRYESQPMVDQRNEPPSHYPAHLARRAVPAALALSVAALAGLTVALRRRRR
jgi:hypothetical protein